jgi:hypothetical protein
MLSKPTSRPEYMKTAGPKLLNNHGANAVQVVLESEGQAGVETLKDVLDVKDPLLRFASNVRSRQLQVGPLSPPALSSRQNELLKAAIEVALGIGVSCAAVSTVYGQVRLPRSFGGASRVHTPSRAAACRSCFASSSSPHLASSPMLQVDVQFTDAELADLVVGEKRAKESLVAAELNLGRVMKEHNYTAAALCRKDSLIVDERAFCGVLGEHSAHGANDSERHVRRRTA